MRERSVLLMIVTLSNASAAVPPSRTEEAAPYHLLLLCDPQPPSSAQQPCCCPVRKPGAASTEGLWKLQAAARAQVPALHLQALHQPAPATRMAFWATFYATRLLQF